MTGTTLPGLVEDAQELLSHGRVRLLGLMPFASNYTFLAEVSDGARSVLAVYKPRRGEMPLWDFPEGTLCQREVGAYRLSLALGWPRVPPTILRDGPHGPGALQLFISADLQEHFFTMRDERREEFRSIAAFDVIANNADRKGGHCLRAFDGTMWVVDHGVCFHSVPKLRTVIWDFAGDPIPQPQLDDIRRVATELRSGALGRDLESLLTTAEVESAAMRADILGRTGCLPAPTGDRPYPWPPV